LRYQTKLAILIAIIMANVPKPQTAGGMILRIVCVVIVVVWIGHHFGEAPPSSSAQATPVSAEAIDPKTVAMQATSIAKFRWYKEDISSIMMATFTIKNDGNTPVKDIEIKCVHSAPSGTVIDSNTRTIYQVIPPHKARTFRDFNMGFINSQASSSNCGIEDLAIPG
jgi:hypothetical protein